MRLIRPFVPFTVTLAAALAAAPAVSPGAAAGTGEPLAAYAARIAAEFPNPRPKLWGQDGIPGVRGTISVAGALALTLDLCGSPGDGFDPRILAVLERHKVPATVFASGAWLARHPDAARRLAGHPLVSFGNHGHAHLAASVNGRTAWGWPGTADVAALVREIERQTAALAALGGKRPGWYRSGWAFYDEVAARVVGRLGYRIAGFALAGDASTRTTRAAIAAELLRARAGDILLCHLNKPWLPIAGALDDALPALKNRGLSFVRLDDVPR